MPDEFVDRYRLQREAIAVVNDSLELKEELCGLSGSAIDRWESINCISDGDLVSALREIASLLFFLSTKSQDPVSEQYRRRVGELRGALGQLRRAVRSEV
ncbi:MAG: hypothetical protein WD382_04555 [Halofilum sp. (in: g-proteobacteria)]